jgi:hypothetical protein
MERDNVVEQLQVDFEVWTRLCKLQEDHDTRLGRWYTVYVPDLLQLSDLTDKLRVKVDKQPDGCPIQQAYLRSGRHWIKPSPLMQTNAILCNSGQRIVRISGKSHNSLECKTNGIPPMFLKPDDLNIRTSIKP